MAAEVGNDCSHRTMTEGPNVTVDAESSQLDGIRARFQRDWPTVIEVRSGWTALLVELDQQLAAIAPSYVVQQIKSKFGALCFYAMPSDDPYDYNEDFKAAIEAAEWQSIRTCEQCGDDAGQYVIDLWVSTLCPQHAAEAHSSPDAEKTPTVSPPG